MIFLLDIWPLERLESQDNNPNTSQEWFVTKYTDGRPAGGVLMTNVYGGDIIQLPTTTTEQERILMSLFLCENLLLRPIRFQATALLEADEINNVIQTDAACVGCHNTLDPLASAFFGFWWFDIYDRGELSRYHPEREFWGEEIDYLNTPWPILDNPCTHPPNSEPMSLPIRALSLVLSKKRHTDLATKYFYRRS